MTDDPTSTPRVTRRLRFEILRRDGYACRYCGAKAPDVALTVDHVIPTTLGGSNDPSNLVACCQPCNGGKSSIAPDSAVVADVERDALRWKRAVELAAEMSAAALRARADAMDEFASAWHAAWEVDHGPDRCPPVPLNWADSVERWLSLGLTMDHLYDLISTTFGKSYVEKREMWKYFCGCCWRTLSNIHEEARLILEDEEAEVTE